MDRRYYLVLRLLILTMPFPLYAQFLGGRGEGSDQRQTIQLNLDGIPGGIRPLYAGGPGDGHDRSQVFISLQGQQAIAIYGGGVGDGHSQLSASFTVDGESLAQIYGGGQGDGYSNSQEQVSLNGFSATMLYGGGSGDGYDDLIASATLNGGLVNQLFSGGDGDGFAKLSISSGLMGFSPTALYGGGNGDGFDRQSFSSSLGGIDLSILYQGGFGDGYDDSGFAGAIPLPLTLISFDAFPETDFVLLRWVTEDEVGTDFFTIEKTRDGHTFAWVGEELAAGFSEPGEQLHYEHRDYDPYLGTSYYRLQTTDFDGAVSYSHLVAVNYEDPVATWNFQLFPNPNTGRHFSLNLEGEFTEERLRLEVLDAQGRSVLQEEFTAQTNYSERFDLLHQLSPGYYLIRVLHPSGTQRTKILLVGR
ncbi:MAG: T9SS type A sorting domain-containing protein [Bacteroidota bacterium]